MKITALFEMDIPDGLHGEDIEGLIMEAEEMLNGKCKVWHLTKVKG